MVMALKTFVVVDEHLITMQEAGGGDWVTNIFLREVKTTEQLAELLKWVYEKGTVDGSKWENF